MSSGKIKLGYWKIRGLAEAMRMMLNYADVDYENVMYECGDAPDFDRSDWLNVKFTLGLDFPNLPYLIDGDVKLTQSISILHYLSVKTGLFPKGVSMGEISRYDMLDHVITDFISVGSRLCYSSAEDYAANKPAAMVKAKEFIKQFSDALGNRKFVAGDDITGTDFWLFEALDKFTRMEPNIIEPDNIKEYMNRIKGLPQLKKYFSSPESTRKLPLNNKRAAFK